MLHAKNENMKIVLLLSCWYFADNLDAAVARKGHSLDSHEAIMAGHDDGN